MMREQALEMAKKLINENPSGIVMDIGLFADVITDVYEEGFKEGQTEGYEDGYEEGFYDGQSQ